GSLTIADSYQCRLTDCPRSRPPGGQKHQPLGDGQQRAREWSQGYKGRSIRFSSSSDVDSLGLATVSDLKNACEIDVGALLNVGDTPPLTSTSSPALLRFDTDSRGPPSDVAERIASHAATIFAFDVALLDDASDASGVTQLDAFNALVAPLSLRVAVLVERCCPLDNVADAFDVALLDALDVAVAICVAALIERRRANRSSATTNRSPRVRTCLARVQMRPARATRASSSRAGGLLIDCVEDSDVDIAPLSGLVYISLRAGLVEGERVSVKGRRRTPAKSDRASCTILRVVHARKTPCSPVVYAMYLLHSVY
ncbi:hypothetical protein EV715DRAFT_268670, partial [Schizophyllum commune]